jgi:hypothetical protein
MIKNRCLTKLPAEEHMALHVDVIRPNNDNTRIGVTMNHLYHPSNLEQKSKIANRNIERL